MSYRVKEINLHITEWCSGHCPMCYATDENMTRRHGDFQTLKKIIHNAIAFGKVERFVMVGGDPCEYPYLVNLLKYIKEEGNKYNIKTKSMVISNTHDYRENGKIIEIEEISSLLDGVCLTIHGETAKKHDEFNGCKGSYEHVLENLRKYIKVKSDNQEVCIIVNLMPSNIKSMQDIIINTNNELNGKIDSIAIQRIAPIGRACGSEKYFIEKEDINPVLEIFKNMKERYGFYLEFVDAFPLCSVKPEYWDLFYTGGCNWGTDYCAVFSDGSISRCAMSERKLSKNMVDLDGSEKFKDFWENDKDLIKFRNKEHLDKICKKCNLLDRCGGGCALGRKTGDPYKLDIPEIGHDYLVNRKNNKS